MKEEEKKNREFVNIIHEGELKFPDKEQEGRLINVTYKYDTSGKLHCTFQDETSKEKYEISFKMDAMRI